MKPIVDELEKTYRDNFDIVRINVDKSDGRALAREYGIVGQPSYIFFDRSGEEIRRLAGPQFADTLVAEIERILGE